MRALLWKSALISVLAAVYLSRLDTFSGHMAAHLLLSLVTPPLLLAWLAGWPGLWQPQVPAWLGFLALNAVTVGAHLPGLNRVLMMTPALAVAEGAAFLAAGMMFWSAVRRGGWTAVGLLGVQMAACALLGAAITFSQGVYMGRPDDVALGGVLMWVAGGGVYTAWGLALITRALWLPEAVWSPKALRLPETGMPRLSEDSL